jgi:hypothetical protein
VPRLGRGSHQSVRPAEDAVDGTGHPPREPGNATAARWPRGRGVSRVGRCWIASSAVTFPGFGCLVERAGRFGSGSARSRLRSRVGGWQNGGELNLAARKRAVKARFVTRGGRKALMRRVLREREGSGWSWRLRPPARHLGRPPQIERQQEWGTPVDQTAWDGRGKHQRQEGATPRCLSRFGQRLLCGQRGGVEPRTVSLPRPARAPRGPFGTRLEVRLARADVAG